MAVDLNDVCYVHGTFFLVPMTEGPQEAGYRGVVSIDAKDYEPLKAKGLMDQRAQVTMIVSDNDITDTEGWDGEVGVRTIRVDNIDPKAQLMIAEDQVADIIAKGITDGTYCDITVAKLA